MRFLKARKSLDESQANLYNELFVLLILLASDALNEALNVPEHGFLLLLIILHLHPVDEDGDEVRHLVSHLPVVFAESSLHPQH